MREASLQKVQSGTPRSLWYLGHWIKEAHAAQAGSSSEGPSLPFSATLADGPSPALMSLDVLVSVMTVDLVRSLGYSGTKWAQGVSF